MAAFDPATLDRWRALAIVDREGTTVGTISEFYLDRETGHPTWALVDTGLFGATQTFVPLVHATEISDGLQVPYAKSHIKDSPRVDPHDELTPDEEATLFAHYGVEYSPLPETSAGDEETAGSAAAAQGPYEEAVKGPGPVPAEPGTAGSPPTAGEGPGDGQAPGPESTEPESAGSPSADDEGRRVGEGPGPVVAAPDSGAASDGVPAEPGSVDGPEVVDRAARPVPADSPEAAQAEAEPDAARADRYGSDPGGGGAGVPEEPGTAAPDEAQSVDANRAWSDGMERADMGSAVEHGEEAPPGPNPDRFRSTTAAAEPDLGRTAPVEPGLPGSTAASPYGPAATIDKGTDPADQVTEERLRPPDEAGWAPGAAGSFEEPEPVDRPPGASDRWREAKLAAERDRIARATAAQPEERSPLERARRRLERLVGVGQESHDAEPISPAEREAAERARLARLGLDEDEHRRR
jgi:hypothetical protein